MQNLKTIAFAAGILLLILAVAIGYLSIKNLSAIRSADSYEDNLPELLGKPTINLSTFQIMYLEQTLDDGHIIEFEYADDFEEFFYFNIDG